MTVSSLRREQVAPVAAGGRGGGDDETVGSKLSQPGPQCVEALAGGPGDVVDALVRGGVEDGQDLPACTADLSASLESRQNVGAVPGANEQAEATEPDHDLTDA